MIFRNIIHALVSVSFLLFVVMFMDSVFGTQIYDKYLYYKPIHNHLVIMLLVLFILLPVYGFVRLFFKHDTTNPFNYLAILGSLLYLYPIYLELIGKNM